MDVRAKIKAWSPSRHLTEQRERALHRSADATVGRTMARGRKPPAGFAAGEKIALDRFVHDTITRKGLDKPAAGVAACSLDAAQHVPAIANECSIKFDLFGAAAIFKKTPCIAGLKPRGRYVAKDMFDAAVIPVLTKTLLDHDCLHGDRITVPGRMTAVNLQGVKRKSARQVGPAVNGAITRKGSAQEKLCYADI